MQNDTTKCNRFEHPEFRLVFDSSVPSVDVDWLIRLLEEQVTTGAKFCDRETIELGSMLFRVEFEDGILILSEPDFKQFPIVWTQGVSNNLRNLRLQKDIYESFDFDDEMALPSILQSMIVGTDLSPLAKSFLLSRVQCSGADSGWFVGRPDSKLDYNNPDNLRRTSVYQAMIDFPSIVACLGLPSGLTVEISQSQIAVSREGVRSPVRPNSFLARVSATKRGRSVPG